MNYPETKPLSEIVYNELYDIVETMCMEESAEETFESVFTVAHTLAKRLHGIAATTEILAALAAAAGDVVHDFGI